MWYEYATFFFIALGMICLTMSAFINGPTSQQRDDAINRLWIGFYFLVIVLCIQGIGLTMITGAPAITLQTSVTLLIIALLLLLFAWDILRKGSELLYNMTIATVILIGIIIMTQHNHTTV